MIADTPKGRAEWLHPFELEGKKVYLSGDTEDIPECVALNWNDVAFVLYESPLPPWM